ncbi:putative ATPase [Flexibacter flexilis DSM 6793]|uniref:Replication-associated recombination protein A n=1 Tax=Flexibacter flexilis DSM 6793 TaxID=927664 RepID=A0A1I1G1M6_9BACT|nr:replication-associated recombination protein A [Flexibacter flexilis]SFC05514.1 putative ATPase [Flexibacter flexilis DSM 6793]
MFEPSLPLAERMRPYSLEQFTGQAHLVGENGVLRRVISSGIVPSMIFWGPPGVGKTTLANIIAAQVKMPFQMLSAVSTGVKDVREVIERAKQTGKRTILFIDEIHHFNKSQQDALLAAVEKGQITLIGATTENPSFEVNAALLSRCQVYVLEALTEENLLELLRQAIAQDKWLQQFTIHLKETDKLLLLSGGDARKLLNLFELVVEMSDVGSTVEITDELVQHVAQTQTARYDKVGEQHYDIASAFIKSLRGSDPNAAVYWLARMLEGGENLKFIARRMLIMASEDIGNANPTAMILANNCFQAVAAVGYPEAEIILSQTAVYLACSAKSNASYMAIKTARQLVRQTGDLPVPLHLRNAPTNLMKQQGYGKNYEYSHNYENHFSVQQYLPDAISYKKLYEPANNPRENEMRMQLRKLWNDKYGY